MDLNERVNTIQQRDDFVGFVRALSVSLDDERSDWENCDLSSYLEALAAWVADMDGYYKNRGEAVPQQPTWKTLAQVLLAARVYE
jgi:hypothetical protein